MTVTHPKHRQAAPILMNTQTPTPSGLDIAALLERCRQTHADDLAAEFTRNQTFARRLVQSVMWRGVSREDFHDALSFASMPLPDEPADRFHARRSGFYEGLIAGMGDLSAR